MLEQNDPIYNVVDFSLKCRIFLLFSAVIANKRAVNKVVAHSNQTACLKRAKRVVEVYCFLQESIFDNMHQQ